MRDINAFNYPRLKCGLIEAWRDEIISKFLNDFICYSIEFPITWCSIMESLHNDLLPYKGKIIIEQLKEKFYFLRVYYTMEGNKVNIDKVDKIIDKHDRMIKKLYIRHGLNPLY